MKKVFYFKDINWIAIFLSIIFYNFVVILTNFLATNSHSLIVYLGCFLLSVFYTISYIIQYIIKIEIKDEKIIIYQILRKNEFNIYDLSVKEKAVPNLLTKSDYRLVFRFSTLKKKFIIDNDLCSRYKELKEFLVIKNLLED